MNKEYWKEFYKNTDLSHGCSDFALFCLDNEYIVPKNHIVDLGCGNFRDSNYFSGYSCNVTAIDQVKAPDPMASNITFFKANFCEFDYSTIDVVDVFYSRFTLHAISEEDRKALYKTLEEHCRAGALLAIECRSTKDKTCFIDNHDRTFIDSYELLADLDYHDFNLRYFNESDGLSVTREENPILIRAIFEKR